MTYINKSIIFLTLLFLTTFVVIKPLQVFAFDPAQLIDPFCIFACEKEKKTTTTITNSYNTNSTINSNNTTINSGSATVTSRPTVSTRDEIRKPLPNTTVTTPVVVTRPIYVETTPIYPTYTYPTSYPTYYSQLGASCYSTPTSGNIGDSISWRSSVYGGTGNYNISWSGNDGLYGYGSSLYKTYYSTGSKYASITVTSGNQTITQNCSNSVEIYDYRYNNNYNYGYNNNYNYYYSSPLYVSCYSNTTFSPTENNVTWQANASGGNGSYSYSWSGTDYLNGYGRSLSTIYHSPGAKTASVTVYSGNQTITQICSNSVTVGIPTGSYYNQGIYNPNNIQIACYADQSSIKVGNSVIWSVEASGSTGNFTYSWSGTDGLFGNQSSVAKYYDIAGTKSAIVTVTASNGQTSSQVCGNTVSVKNPSQSLTKKTKPVVTATVDKTESITKNENNGLMAAVLSLNNVPWVLVAMVIIFLLMFTVMYLLFNRNKI